MARLRTPWPEETTDRRAAHGVERTRTQHVWVVPLWSRRTEPGEGGRATAQRSTKRANHGAHMACLPAAMSAMYVLHRARGQRTAALRAVRQCASARAKMSRWFARGRPYPVMLETTPRNPLSTAPITPLPLRKGISHQPHSFLHRLDRTARSTTIPSVPAWAATLTSTVAREAAPPRVPPPARVMEGTSAAIRSVLSKVLKAKVAGASRSPNPFVLFGKAQRQAKGKVSFQEIGAAWKAMGSAEKAVYESQAQQAKENFLPVAPAEAASEEASWPKTIKLKDEAALDALAKKVAEEAVKQFMQQLVLQANASDGSPQKIPKVGRIVAALKEPDGKTKSLKSPPVVIEFAPSTKLFPL